MNKEDRYMFLTQEYADAMEKHNIRKLILLNRRLYEDTFRRYIELINWKKHSKWLSKQSLDNIDSGINAALYILKNLQEHGIGLSILYPQELNSEEEK